MGRVESRGVVTFAAVVAALLPVILPFGAAAAPAAAATWPPGRNCTRRCGKIDIPYPFGIEPGCYHAAGFNLTCRDGSTWRRPPELFLGDGTVQVLEISVPNATVRIKSSSVEFRDDGAAHGITVNGTWGASIPQDGTYFLLQRYSKLRATGCNIEVDVRGGEGDQLIASCSAICPSVPTGSQDGPVYLVGDGNCAGIRCCQANIDIGYSFYNIQIHKSNETATGLGETNSVYIVDRNFGYTQRDMMHPQPEAVPATLDWIIASNSTCPKNSAASECLSANSSCMDIETDAGLGTRGYRCGCDTGYQGNPYIRDGCKDINECEFPHIYLCYGDCENKNGSYICRCPSGYKGNASVANGCKDIDECKNTEAHHCYGTCLNFPGTFQCQCPNGTYGDPWKEGGCIIVKNSTTGLSIGIGVGGGTSLLLVALGAPFIIRKIRQRKAKKMREKFFNQNHGLLLQQFISQNADIGRRMIITLRALEKATNNFDRSRVIGGGGHGVVFKGIIDLHVVAVKKSKIIVQREISEFINEVAVLSQINHRNVVKLIGCCLETEVPLLVYEFISNGTLYHHLHGEGPVSLLWVDRIRIALEVARALSYLHSAASMPIFHRDIKSTNILLDDSLTAKVSDFGASRYIPIDQTEGVTTEVQGTRGYLDPMYYYTGRLTDKSDVFSFGVLLVELLTRKQPFIYRSEHGENLVSHFIKLLATDKLDRIIDHQVVDEGYGQIQEVATLAVMCTKLRGEDRPTMREVEMTLEKILVMKKQDPCIIIPKRDAKDETSSDHFVSVERVSTDEVSRQYTMEEEILLSASYPR